MISMCIGELFGMSSSVHEMDGQQENELLPATESSFINRLSPEILSQILSHSSLLPTHDWETRPSSLKVSEVPLIFGRVCSYWRELTYSTPALWSQISVTIPRGDADSREEILDRLYKSLELQISLSKSYPIDITISSGNIRNGFWLREDVCKAYAIVVPHIWRWRNIHIDSTLPRSFLQPMFKQLAAGAPMLETIEFSLASEGGIADDEDPPGTLIADFTSAPLLKEIRMGVAEVVNFTRIIGPKHMPRTIIDYFFNMDVFFGIFKSFPNSSYIEGTVFDSFDGPERLVQYPLVRNVHTLNIELIDFSRSPQGDGTRAFDMICLPLLEELSVAYGDPPNLMKFPVPKLIRRFGCNLKKLVLDTLNDHFTFDHDILPILQLSPNLQELHLIGDVDTSVFDGLAAMSLVRNESSGYSVLCPELIKLRFSVRDPAPYEAIYAMVSFRGQLVPENCEKNDGFITFVGRMRVLRDRPNVISCFRKYGVKCALELLDEGSPVDEYLDKLLRDEAVIRTNSPQ